MKTVKIGNLLYCYIKDGNEFNQILEQETPEYSYDLIEEHRKDMGSFNGAGFYIIEYIVFNPCWHGFDIEKKNKSEINSLVKTLQKLLTQSSRKKVCHV